MKLYQSIEEFIKDNNLNNDVVCFLRSLTSDITPGIHKLSNSNFVNVIEYQTESLPSEDVEFENHHKYIDVHICLKGKETVLLSNKSICKVKLPYEQNGDYESLVGKQIEKANIDSFQPLFVDIDIPHAPGYINGERVQVKKAILKLVKA